MLLCRSCTCLPQIHSLLSPDVFGFVLAADYASQTAISAGFPWTQPVGDSGGRMERGRRGEARIFLNSTLLRSHSHSQLSLGSIPHGCSSHMGPACTREASHDSSFYRWSLLQELLTLTLCSSGLRTGNSFLLLFICGLSQHLLLGFWAIGYHTTWQ